ARVLAAGGSRGWPLDSGIFLARRGQRSEARSDADGVFAFDELEPGALRFAVRAAGFAPLDLEGRSLPPGGSLELGEIALEPGVAVSGVVTDLRGAPVEGAEIYLPLEGGTEVLFSPRPAGTLAAVTLVDGTFRADVLPPGPWRFQIHAEDHPDAVVEGVLDSPGAEHAGLRIRLEDGGTISGTVFAGRGERLEDLVVRAGREPGGSASPAARFDLFREAACDAAGRFTLRGLMSAELYRLRVRAARDGGADPRWLCAPLEALPGERNVEIVLAGSAAAVLAVRVEGGDAPAEIHVAVESSLRGARESRTRSGPDDGLERLADGRLRLSGLRAGAEWTTRLTVVAQGFQPLSLELGRLAPGEERDLGAIALSELPSLVVRVVDSASGAPLEGARVELELERSPGESRVWIEEETGRRDAARTARSLTDQDGHARLAAPRDATGWVRAGLEGRAPSLPIEVPTGGDGSRSVTIALGLGGSVEVLVLDAEGSALPGERVQARPIEAQPGNGPRQRARQSELSDAAGRARFAHLAPGLYGFALDIGPRGGVRGDPIEVSEGSRAEVVLRAAPRATLEGRVRESGRALVGASVALVPGRVRDASGISRDAGRRLHERRTDAAGRYAFDQTAEGNWTLVVEHPSRALPELRPTELQPGANVLDVDLGVSLVEGTVRDGAGRPLAGIRVRMGTGRPPRPGQGTFVHSSFAEGPVLAEPAAGGAEAISDVDGRWELRGAPPDVALWVQAEGRDHQPARAERLRVRQDSVLSGVDLVLQPAGRLAVLVTAGGMPARGVAVRPRRRPEGGGLEHGQPAYTDALGRAELRGLAPGAWTLIASARNRRPPAERTVEVAAGKTVEIELELE
ncbi:MAG TPA: hypothetical protein VMS76_00780, partial [Planctomycetota bacterium]|nr:hypothetical protein [Planctomycetota bacterium]